MQPGSFALLTSKLQTGPIATEAVDLLTSNYKKSYESNIENFVDRAYQVCKLDNKKDRSAVLQWAMDKNIDSEKLDKLVNICAQHKNIPATEIIKLSSRSQNVTANLEHLQKLCVDPKLEPGILKLCNNTGINPAVLNGMYGSSVEKKMSVQFLPMLMRYNQILNQNRLAILWSSSSRWTLPSLGN